MLVQRSLALVAMLALLEACGQGAAAVPTTEPTPVPPTVAPPAIAPTITAAPEPAPTLVGTWRTTVTTDDLLRVVPDFLPDYLCDNAGTFIWQFRPDGTFAQTKTAPQDGCPPPASQTIEDTWSSEAQTLTIAKGTPDEESYGWSVDGDRLTFTHRAGGCVPCKAINTAHCSNHESRKKNTNFRFTSVLSV